MFMKTLYLHWVEGTPQLCQFASESQVKFRTNQHLFIVCAKLSLSPFDQNLLSHLLTQHTLKLP